MTQDSANLVVTVSFRELDLFSYMTLRIPKVGAPRFAGNLIKEKWLYVFWSTGNRYAFPPNAVGRTEDAWGYQHMAPRGHKENPQSTSEHAKNVWQELFFVGNGRFGALHIGPSPEGKTSGLWSKERWERIALNRSGGGGQEKTTLDLPLRAGKRRRGPKIRYYFLLSPVRLGPRALRAATLSGGGDGLSVWTQRDRSSRKSKNDKNRHVEAPDASYFKERKSTKATVSIVDPYQIATNLEESVSRVLQSHASVQDAMVHGGTPYGQLPRLKGLKIVGGTPYDAYFIAKVFRAVRTQVKGGTEWPWDEKLATQVIEPVVEKYAKEHKNTVEMEARMLANWLAGPAHRLIDIGVAEDTRPAEKAPKRAEDQEEAAVDRAFGLLHWYNVTTFLQFTESGAAFIANISKHVPHNPVVKILMRYTSVPLQDEIDKKTFRIAAPVIPDLGIRLTLLNIHHGDSAKDRRIALNKRIDSLTALMNNISYLPAKVSTAVYKPSEVGVMYTGDVKRYVEAGLFITDSVGTVPQKIAGCILDQVVDIRKLHNTHLGQAVGRAIQKNPSMGQRLLMMYEGKYLTKYKKATASVGLFVSMVNILVAWSETAGKLKDERVKKGDRIDAIVGSALDTAKLTTDILEFSKVDKTVWTKVIRTARAQGLRAVLRAGTLVSFVGSVASVWCIYSAHKEIKGGWATSDYSVMGGGFMIAIGGALTLAALVAEIPYAGWIAAVFILGGGFIVAFTKDHPLEVFITHSMYGTRANCRYWGGKDHWAGPEFGGRQRNIWPLAHQRWALENLIAPFKIRAVIDHESVYTEIERQSCLIRTPIIRSIQVRLRMGYMPPGSTLVISIKGALGKMLKHHDNTWLKPGNKPEELLVIKHELDSSATVEQSKSVLKLSGTRIRPATKAEPMMLIFDIKVKGPPVLEASYIEGRFTLVRRGGAEVYGEFPLGEVKYAAGGWKDQGFWYFNVENTERDAAKYRVMSTSALPLAGV